jgi:hypothetical protein
MESAMARGLLGIFLWSTSLAMASALYDPGERIAELCTSDTSEGRYTVSLGALGKFYIYIVCVGNDSIDATMVEAAKNNNNNNAIPVSMVHVAVDDDIIHFVTYKLEGGEAKERSAFGGNDTHLRLDFAKLKSGIISGTVRGLYSKRPVQFEAARDLQFPQLLALADFHPIFVSNLWATSWSPMGRAKFLVRFRRSPSPPILSPAFSGLILTAPPPWQPPCLTE